MQTYSQVLEKFTKLIQSGFSLGNGLKCEAIFIRNFDIDNKFTGQSISIFLYPYTTSISYTYYSKKKNRLIQDKSYEVRII